MYLNQLLIKYSMVIKTKLDIPKQRTMQVPCSVWKRFFAFIIDLLILDIIIFNSLKNIILNIIPNNLPYTELALFIENNPDILNKIMVIFIYLSLIIIIYFTVLEFKFSQTVGKMLLGIFVKSSNKKPLTFTRVLLSNIIFIPIFPFVLFWLIEPLYILFTNRRIMEKISNIKVVQEVLI